MTIHRRNPLSGIILSHPTVRRRCFLKERLNYALLIPILTYKIIFSWVGEDMPAQLKKQKLGTIQRLKKTVIAYRKFCLTTTLALGILLKATVLKQTQITVICKLLFQGTSIQRPQQIY